MSRFEQCLRFGARRDPAECPFAGATDRGRGIREAQQGAGASPSSQPAMNAPRNTSPAPVVSTGSMANAGS